MTNEESEVMKGMADFYRRTKESLPQIEPAKPFEVRVDIQETKSSPFKNDAPIQMVEDEQPSALAPPPPGITAVDPNVVSSAGGTTITIIGSNFLTGATVKIAGADATSVNVISDTKISCVTPADGIGFVTIEVTNPSAQSVSNSNLLRYTNFPDNFVLSGQHSVAGYQGCALGPDYVYTVTARLGNQDFTPPPGVVVYAWIGLYQDAGSCGLENPFQVIINNSTGPTVSRSFGFAIRAVTPGSYGAASVLMAIWASSDGSIGIRYPTYGDLSYQPTAFRIDIAGNGPPPIGGGGGEFFSWSGTNPNSNRTNPWAWDPGESFPIHPVTIKRLDSSGAVVTSYNGTATLTLTHDTPFGGQLFTSYPTTVTFVSGTANFGLSFSYSYVSAGNPQSSAFFHLTATDGSTHNNSPGCAALNHL